MPRQKMYDDGIQQIVPEAPCVSNESFFSVERLATNTKSVYARVLSQGFIQIDRCSRSSHCCIFIEKWRGLAAFVISDEFHHVDVTTTSNNVCHSQKGCNVTTYPRTSRLVFGLLFTHNLFVQNCFSRTTVVFLRLPAIYSDMFAIPTMEGFVSMEAVTSTTSLSSLLQPLHL